jgi:outer membrane protein OmpA-like peptidoglycan-associated protein
VLKIAKLCSALLLTLGVCTLANAQTNAPADTSNPTPTFRVNVVSRTTPAVNYGHRGGSTKINFRGTELMPGAQGAATVQSKRGDTKVVVELRDLQKTTSFGNEYLTYVLWAISPEGRPVNLGEILVGGNHRSKLETTTQLQAFALIVTAEPYYAVRRPSNLVVLENEVRPDTIGTTEAVESKYELIDRGGYLPTGYTFDPVVISARLPLEFYEARNAMRIAKSAGAQQYATPSYDKAVLQMKEADDLAIRKHSDKKSLISASREAVQTAEDAREISMKNIETARREAELAASADREANANANADLEAQRRSTAELATSDAVRREQDAKAKADLESQRRMAAENATSDAQADAQKSAEAQAEAERARAAAQQQQQAAEADSDRNRAAAASSNQQLQQAVLDREELRARLLAQLNAILVTRDTARGLVVNMSDVLFDSGKFTLRPLAREKLAKISGIILAYPSLKLAIEGNTDSVGSEAFNQTLSEQRAQGVRSYLTQEGVPESSTSARGFGKDQPIASNDSAEGRQQNRRVELVVSGDVIGTEIGTPVVQPIATLSPR